MHFEKTPSFQICNENCLEICCHQKYSAIFKKITFRFVQIKSLATHISIKGKWMELTLLVWHDKVLYTQFHTNISPGTYNIWYLMFLQLLSVCSFCSFLTIQIWVNSDRVVNHLKMILAVCTITIIVHHHNLPQIKWKIIEIQFLLEREMWMVKKKEERRFHLRRRNFFWRWTFSHQRGGKKYTKASSKPQCWGLSCCLFESW